MLMAGDTLLIPNFRVSSTKDKQADIMANLALRTYRGNRSGSIASTALALKSFMLRVIISLQADIWAAYSIIASSKSTILLFSANVSNRPSTRTMVNVCSIQSICSRIFRRGTLAFSSRYANVH